MKRIGSLLVVLFLLMTGCGDSKQSAEDLITVDVTASYPKKELILQDFMDVEYIALETNDEFVNQGFVQAIGKKYILVKNRSADGNIFVYDRSGKAFSGNRYILIKKCFSLMKHLFHYIETTVSLGRNKIRLISFYHSYCSTYSSNTGAS